MIGCLAVVFTVDRVEDEVVVLEVGAVSIDVAGLPGAREGARFVLCELPFSPAGVAPASAAASTPAPPGTRVSAQTAPAT